MATDNKTQTAAPEITAGADGETGAGTERADDGTASDAEESASESLSLDIIFEILRNRRRQLVLEFIREQEGTVTIGELAEHIAAIENDTSVRQLNAQQRKRVYIGLYQCHLPKMDDVDVIEFNQSRGRISPGEHIEPLYEYLDVANGDTDEDDEPPFERKHGAGFVAFTAAFFLAQMSGAYVLASAFVLLFVVATLAVVSPRF
ncbi:hypothetical protein [Halorubrum sp. SD683]|uniref:DUF7344 domain-containing protein n=1 Tax=Halorubrum sp. SD683 TaxID=1855873 RepID=UPI000A2E971D|nr:hypothetical protein [Halorubrum sp. SD683]OTF01983.1 hypothetical protein B9G49_01690 [Halorubrum sp. SD683]